MNKAKFKSIVSGILAVTLIASPFSGLSFTPVSAAATEGKSWASDAWTLKSTGGSETHQIIQQGAVQAIHFKSGTGNDNSKKPAVILNESAKKMGDIHLKANIRTTQDKSDTRFGIYMRFTDINHCVFVGYDSLGWFWQVYNGSNSPYYTGNRVAAPNPNETTAVDIVLKENKLSLSIKPEGSSKYKTVFNKENLSNTEGLKDGKFGFKAGAWGTQYTEAYISNVSYASDTTSAEMTSAETDSWNLFNPQGHEVNQMVQDGGTPILHFKSGNKNDNNNNPAILVDKTAGVCKNGKIKFNFVPNADAAKNRFGIVYRYTDPTHYAMVGYDNGGWFWQIYNGNKAPWYQGTRQKAPNKGEKVSVELGFVNNTLNFIVNGKSVFNNVSIPESDQLKAGLIGFRAATYGSDYTDVNISDIAYQTEEVVPETPTEPRIYENRNGDITGFKSLTKNSTFTTVDNGNNGKAIQIVTTGSGHHVTVDTKAPQIKNGVFEADVTPVSGSADGTRFGLSMRTADGSNRVYVGSGDTKDTWFWENFHNNTSNWSDMYPGAVLEPGQTSHIKVCLENKIATLWVNNKKIFSHEISEDTPKQGFFGFETRTQSKYIVDNIVVREILPPKAPAENPDTLRTDKMTVRVDKVFPRVIDYTWNQTQDKFLGQTNSIYGVLINGIMLAPTTSGVKYEKKNGQTAEYTLPVKDVDNKIDAVLTVTISVKDNNLTYKISKVQNNLKDAPIQTISIPQLNLLTITSEQSEAAFAGATVGGNTTVVNDEYANVSKNQAPKRSNYAYAFVSTDKLSAGLWSNSEVGHDLRVAVNSKKGIYNTVSLTSSPWYYQYPGMPVPEKELPCAKVCITPDINGDKVSNWQDAAIAYRAIMNNPKGCEDIPNLVAQRIAMNFASQATNPFLKTLDNVKRVYLATDGLGQSVLLKGYANEGHDSGHPDYGDIGERMGGEAGLKVLTDNKQKYNTQIGVHVNAQETYPEAKAFNEKLINGKPDGWDWLDPSYSINRIYDLSSGNRRARFQQLRDKSNLDFIYLDVWYGDSWESRHIAQEINDMGWRLETEFGTAVEYDATWQHWATDINYGGADHKGINSEIIRFIRNHQKDSWVANCPRYKGTADNPLLGGYELQGFEGWQGDKNLDNFLRTTFDVNLPTKFLQHYQITNWTDVSGDSSLTNLEKQIKLQSKDGTNKVEVSRKENSRERVITLNGAKVLDEHTYLLPWYWKNGDTEKLYHWNLKGGTTTWQLPKDWQSLKNVKVYELSEDGRGKVNSVNVENGSVTLTAKAATAYVVYKGEQAPIKITNWGEGTHVVDPGFNSGSLDNYKVTGDTAKAKIVVNHVNSNSRNIPNGNRILEISSPSSETSLSQTITGLEPGKPYVAQVYVDNRSDVPASIEVTCGKKTVSNYTLRSIAKNYIGADAHNTNNSVVGPSYMQRMLVSFVPDSSTATLTLKRAAGDGVTYFDDIRIVQKELNNFKNDNTFTQDFESVVSGIYPFVLGPAYGVSDPRAHLSEKHAPYTQKGWQNRVLDDVISGNWSLKNHQCGMNNLLYQTIPQNFRFEPGVTYKVSFKYETLVKNGYSVIVGNGEFNRQTNYKKENLPVSSDPKVYTTTVTGDKNGQTWLGIYVTGNGAQPSSDQFYSRVGGQDLILDDLSITRADHIVGTANKDTLKMVIAKANALKQTDEYKNVAEAVKTKFDKTLQHAVEVDKNPSATQEQVDSAWKDLLNTIQYLGFEAGDLTNLTALYNANKSRVESDYTPETWKPFEAALKNAKNVISRGNNALKVDVDAAKTQLQKAADGLKKVEHSPIDKTELQKLINEVKNMNFDKFTESSVASLKKSLDNAEKVMKMKLTAEQQGVVDNTVKELRDAKDALVRKTAKNGVNTGTEVKNSPQDYSKTNNKPKKDSAEAKPSSQNNAAKTGEPLQAAPMAILALVSGVAVLGILKQRKK